MTLQLDSGEGYFSVNEESFPVRFYRIVLIDDRVGLTEENSHPVVTPTDFRTWRDSTGTPYASRNDLETDLKAKIFQP